MLRSCLLICSLFCFSFCAGANIKIQISSDNSGDLVTYTKFLEEGKNKKTSERISGLRFLEETELRIQEKQYRFVDYRTMLPPGFRFVEVKDGNKEIVIMGIDTSSKSALLPFLKVDKANIEKIVIAAKKRADLLRFNTLVEHIQFEVLFPFDLESAQFEEQRKPGEWTVRLESNQKLVVNIPMISLWENEYPITSVILEKKK